METGVRIITCAIVFGLAALSANADISTDMLSLVVQADGSAEIINGTSAAIQFDGYEITSAEGSLDPIGWYGISDAVTAETSNVIITLGASTLSMGKLTPSTTCLAEATLSGGAALQAGASWDIGQPFATAPLGEQIGWSYSISSGEVVVVQPSLLLPGTPGRPGDTDMDGDVDLADFQALKSNFTGSAGGIPWGQGNFDGDGDVDFEDFNLLKDNYTGAATGAELIAGDTDVDGDVDIADFNTLKNNFNTGILWSEGNFDGDAVTDLDDFILLKSNFTGAATVPEPATVSLIALGAIAVIKRRK